MTSRIIHTPEGWTQWGPIAEDTTIVDDYRVALQYDHAAWYSTERGDERSTDELNYPVQVVWVPADRDMTTWPDDTLFTPKENR